jgi:superfamily I DNA/RNA helicase
MNPDGGGLNPERVKSNPLYWTYRATQGIRIVACRADGCVQLMGVDRHDDAYNRAAKGTFGEPVPVKAVTEPRPRLTDERKPHLIGPLQDISDAELVRRFGVPGDFLSAVRSVPDSEGLWNIGVADTMADEGFFALLECFPKPQTVSTGAKPVFRLSDAALTGAFAAGEIADLQLNLPVTSWAIVQSTRRAPILVKGGPGSGKTLVALYRALHVLEGEAGLGIVAKPRVLYVTYTKQLCDDARNKVERLLGKIPANLSIETYDHFTLKLGADGRHVLFDEAELVPYIKDAIIGTNLDPEFVQSEITSVIEARNVRTVDEYQRLQRIGRGAALGPKGRITVWGAYERYRKLHDAKRTADLGMTRMVACDAASRLQDGDLYDFVIVDEVQDLQVSSLLMTVNLARGVGTGKHLMLVGDAAQTIHSRRFRWADVGLRIGGGNVYSLRQSERSTQQILDFARAFFAAPTGTLSPDIEQLTASKTGPIPRIVDGLPTDDALYTWLVSDLQARHRDGVPLQNLAVIAHSNKKLAAIGAALEEAEIASIAQNNAQFYRKNAVKLITAHSAKGLEFSEVYIPDAGDGVYPFFANKKIVDSADRAERDVQDCKLLYVAATRAGDRLTIAYIREPSPFLENARALAESVA